MRGNKYTWLVGGLLCLSVVCGCQQSKDGQADSDNGTWEMPVSFVVQSSSASAVSRGSGENPAHANVRPLYTDRIQVNVYSRAKGSCDDADDKTGFTFLKKVVLTCEVQDGTSAYGSRYAYASGVIDMDKAYEYRVTAIGYAEQRNEDDLFSFTDSGAFGDAAVSLTDATQYTTPELFFGTPRYGADMSDKDAGDVVFSYESGAINALGGWLYRCVAGVELTLRDVPPEVKELVLLTDSVNTQCKSTCYDDFLTPDGKQNVAEGDEANKFVLDKWARPDDWMSVYEVENATDSIDVTMNKSNLLPVTSTLYVRITTQEDDEEPEVIVVPLRMKNHVDSSGSTTADADNPDEELAKGVLVSKRNHYYRVAGDYETLIVKKKPIAIFVNPNWDGDIDLILGGK